MMMNYCICFIEYIFLLFWGGCAPPQGQCDRKPTTTAELEPQRTSGCTCNEYRRVRPEQCNTIRPPNIAVGLPSACFEIHNGILFKYIMLYIPFPNNEK